MTIVSRYLIRRFVAPFIFALLLFVLLFVVADLFELLKSAWQQPTAATAIAGYLAHQLPLTVHRLLPVAALLGAYLCFAGLAKTSELTALRAAGLSDPRLWRPLLTVTLAAAAAAVIFALHFQGPLTRAARSERNALSGKPATDTGSVRNFSFILDGRMHLLAEKIAPGGGLLLGVTLSERHPDGLLAFRLEAPRAEATPDSSNLIFRDAEIRRFAPGSDQEQDGYETFPAWLPPQPLPPAVLWSLAGRTDETRSFLTLPELADFAQLLSANGYDARRELIDFHARLAYPLITVVFALLGMAFNPVGRRTNAALGFFLALVVSLVFWVGLGVASALGVQGLLPPWVAGWLPLFALFPVILLVYRYTRRV